MNHEIEVRKERALVYLAELFARLGIKEQGHNKGTAIEFFQSIVDGRASGEPWCMGFARGCVELIDQFFDAIEASSSEERPHSRLADLEHCVMLWEDAELNRISEPRPGCLVIWEKMGADGRPRSRKPWERPGHVGIVVDVKPDGSLVTIEGNTSDDSGVVREGDGIFRKDRDPAGEGSMVVLGFLAPFRAI